MKCILLSILIAPAALMLEGCSSLDDASCQEVVLPTLEPFVQSRMWPVFRALTETEEGDPYPEDSLKKVVEAFGLLHDIQERAKTIAGTPLPGRAAEFEHVSEARRAWLQVVPFAMQRIEPLWGLSGWSEAQLAAARRIADFFCLQEGAPRLRFEPGGNEWNQRQLALLVEWFRAAVEDPAVYARMIVSIDDGPYRALPDKRASLVPDRSRIALDDNLELRLHVDSGSRTPWVLQAARDGEHAWSMVISEVPSDANLTFEGVEAPKRLGPYGWKVHMRFGYPRDIEAAILYLDASGELLFYYTTW